MKLLTQLAPGAAQPGCLILRAIALLLIFQGSAGIAAATGFSLDDLVRSDREFKSTNRQLEFEDFSATVSGPTGVNLASFLLVPLLDGFRIEVASGEALAEGTELILSYTVESEARGPQNHTRPWPHHRPPERPLESMSIGIVGTSILDGPLASGMEAFPEDGNHAASLGEVHASTGPGGTIFAETNLTDPSSEIRVLAYLVAGVDGFFPQMGNRSDDNNDGSYLYEHYYEHHEYYEHNEFESSGNGVEMRFSAVPIPEPSSVLLVGFGLAVLSSWSRQRSKP